MSSILNSYKLDPSWPFLRQTEAKLLNVQQQMAANFDPKRSVWVPDSEEGFLAAKVRATKGETHLVVKTADGNERTLAKEEVQPMNPPKFEMAEDMAELTHLNEASVLHNLRRRYDQMMIYTYSGLFCVAINPYKRLPIYTEIVCKMYIGKRRNEMPPHIFSVCDEAYRNMMNDRENQSLLITGESGAGKTENTKKVISFFTVVGSSGGKKERKRAKLEMTVISGKDSSLEDQMVRTNPVLEAFGNAKTVRNNNSSRFGKFIRIYFNNAGRLAGGDIEHYLLEKSRVIKQQASERSYHIFYQLMSDAIPGLKTKLFLDRPILSYHFVAQAEVIIEGVDDREEMLITDESFDIMMFQELEKFELFALTAAIMHMGEMRFKQRPREEQAEVDDVSEGELACKLFGVDPEKFVTAILKPKVKVGSEWVSKGQNLEQVNYSVGALAKALYARMFAWLIRRCNASLDAKELQREMFVGVLDIAGFEIFDLNSFEQLWINFVNEKLQQFFNHHMFILEQEEYQREAIRWEFIDFGLDLQACIELIEKPLGIISMLDEECIVPKATDGTFVQKLYDQHLNKHPNFQKAKPPKGKQAEAHFSVQHYAETVRYSAKSWLEKNKDPLNDSVVAVLKTNRKMRLMDSIWADYQTQEDVQKQELRGKVLKGKKGKSSTFQTVSMIYRESLNKLVKMLNQTHPHFIRCIIPNEQKWSGRIEANLVLNQLTCNGVLEGIRICRKGFPNRVAYADFKQRYAILAVQEAMDPDPKRAGEAMCKRMERDCSLRGDGFQCGTSKIFFRSGVLASLEELRDQTLSSIIVQLQRICRYHLAQKELKRRLNEKVGVKIVQQNVRRWCTLRSWPWLRLLNRVKPLIEHDKKDEEFESLQKRCTKLESDFVREEKRRRELEMNSEQLKAQRQQLELDLVGERERLVEAEERARRMVGRKEEVEKQMDEMTERLGEQEDHFNGMAKSGKKLEQDNEALKRQIVEMDSTIRRQEGEKQGKDSQLRSLQDEIAALDENIAKLNKERKNQDEINRKIMDEVHSLEDRLVQMNRARQKLEQSLDQTEDALEREKRARQEMVKQRRKMDGELKVARENLEEIGKQKVELENVTKRKETELTTLGSRLEEEQALVARLQRQVKELMGHVQELEEELDQERAARIRTEKARADLQAENDELCERLDEAGGATQAQMEMSKRREAEMAKIRAELEEQNLHNEVLLQAMKKKHADALAELSEQLESMNKARMKADKERQQSEREIDNVQAQLDFEIKQRQNNDRLAKQFESQLLELHTKADEQNSQLAELQAWKSRMQTDHSEAIRQLEEAESQLNALGRLKAQLLGQVEELQGQLDCESRERQAVTAQMSQQQIECLQLQEQLEEGHEQKSELQRLLSRANAETQQWRAKYEGEGLSRTEELEEQRRRILAKSQEVQQQLEQAIAKIVSLEKYRHRMQQELEDAQLDAERANQMVSQLEKKQKGVDRLVEEWSTKCEALTAELEASQRETRTAGTEMFRLRTALDEAIEQAEALRRENKALMLELKEATEQLNDGGRGAHELGKAKRRLELEKEELQLALEDAEAALEAEESKVLRAQVEISQIRSEIEKRIAEKEEEFENSRKMNQRALESIQASLDSESWARSELAKTKKKLENDIGELELSLDQANKANVEAQKHLKRHQEQIRELQHQVDEEQQLREQAQEQWQLTEKRVQMALQEKEEALMEAEQAERARRQAESDALECRERVAEVESANTALHTHRRRLENELTQAKAELADATAVLRGAEETERRAAADAARLAEELRQEQEHAHSQEKQRKALEQHVKELQQRMDEMDTLALRSGKKTITKLEQRMRDLETELESETRRHTDTQKALKSKERRVRELQFQVEEDKKSTDRLYALVERLQQKLRTFKRQNEETEQLANLNLSKYKQMQHLLEDAEERAEIAENSLSKLRTKSRSSANVRGIVGFEVRPSASSAAVLRSSSASFLATHLLSNTLDNRFFGGGVAKAEVSTANLMSKSIHEEEGEGKKEEEKEEEGEEEEEEEEGEKEEE
ncbi:MYSc [Globodera pallida]|nr:MYSc [Globodera pallida]